MQEAKAGAGTMERAELPPSGVACDISCLRELAHFVPLENLFYSSKPWHNKAGGVKPESSTFSVLDF